MKSVLISFLALLFSCHFSQAIPTDVQAPRLSRRTTSGPLDINSASWIWSDTLDDGNDGHNSVAFRRTYLSPLGRSAKFATCQVAADNTYTFFVNGNQIGSAEDWETGQLYSVPLSETANLFAVLATNTGDEPSPAGLILACQIVFSDGAIDTLFSDEKWVYDVSVVFDNPDAFMSPQYWLDWDWFNDAFVEGGFGIPPWNHIPFPAMPSVPSLSGASWIWSNDEASGGTPGSPGGPRPFRKTFNSPSGKTASFATILTACDNSFVAYINGEMVGMYENNFVSEPPTERQAVQQQAQRYVVALQPTTNLFAFAGFNEFSGWDANTPSGLALNPAGLIASITIHYSDASTDHIVSDSSWKTLNLQYNWEDGPPSLPSGFEQPSFSDASWDAATVIATFGVGLGGIWVDNVAIPPVAA